MLCRELQCPYVVSYLPEHYGEDKNASSKPSTFPGLVMTQGMRSVPLTNMGPFRREPQQCSMSHCSLEWCVSCLSVAMMNTMMEATCRTKHLFQLVIREGESPFLAGKAAVGAERWVTISSLQRKQREGAWGWSTGSGARHTSPYRFRSLPKQHQPLKTKCKST